MRILLVTASRHGWTSRVGDEVGAVLRAAGHDVTRQDIQEQDVVAEVLDASGFDAVVLGGSVYTGSWLTRATQAQELLLEGGVPVYAFAVGILGITPDVTEPRWITPRRDETAHERVVLGGRLSREGLSVREKSLLAVVRAKDGEYTDWDAVARWAAAVAADIAALSRA